MLAKYILGALAVVFLAAAGIRVLRGGSVSHAQTKTWLLIGVIFSIVSAWLFYSS